MTIEPGLTSVARYDDRLPRESNDKRTTVRILVVAAIAFGAVIGGGWFGNLRVNLTPSEPIGLWQILPLERPIVVGDLIFICPPPGPVSEFGLARGYFHRGYCPSSVAPLIKMVAALPGAHVNISKDVAIDGTPLPSSRPSPSDGEDRILDPWSGGVVAEGHLFLHSRFVGSYDSRYFGPIPIAGVLGLAQPVLTWDP